MKKIKRLLSGKLSKYLRLFPVVAVIGPRQAGKTTFAKMELPDWKYFDLEKPSDFGRISADREFFLKQYGDKCIIDEAQLLPDLFPALRNFIDEDRTKKGRIVLLGSVNPALIKNISESLAGRIGFIELSAFHFAEASPLRRTALEEFWLRGGYPEPLLWEPDEHSAWMEQYVKTFVERDVLRILKTSLSSQRQIQLLTMFAHSHGKLWNASQIASAFGISYHTINHYIDLMENYFLIRKLAPYHQNVGKRLVKSNKLYFRDTGLLHFLLHISNREALRTSPYRGFSFEGFIIEQLIQKYVRDAMDPVGFYFYRNSQGDEIDLLVQDGNRLIAYEIKTSTAIVPGELKGFQRALEQLQMEKGIVIYFGKEDFLLNPLIEVRSAEGLLGET
ncbi:MAG: ATP-binding protein [Nitrospiraceae bacterium]|nr:MAG: ATP-binding protein [Nitrospiraceae bacterium]